MPKLSDVVEPIRLPTWKDTECCWLTDRGKAGDQSSSSSMRSWGESEKKKTDSLTHMSARALTLTEQGYREIWTGVPGNCLRPRVVSSPYILVGMSEVHSDHKPSTQYWRRAPWRLRGMRQRNAITVSHENGENMFLADFCREPTWPRMSRLRVWTREHRKVCPDFKQET